MTNFILTAGKTSHFLAFIARGLAWLNVIDLYSLKKSAATRILSFDFERFTYVFFDFIDWFCTI